MVIHLANREQVCPIGIVRDVEVLCGKIKYPADFLVLGKEASKTYPIIFGTLFLNTCGAIIDCRKEKVLRKFDGESSEFNFSKNLPKLLMKMKCLMMISGLNNFLLFLLLLTMLCSNLWKIMKVMPL